MTEPSSERIQELTLEELDDISTLVTELLDTLKARQNELKVVEDLHNLAFILRASIKDTINKIKAGSRGES